MIGAWRNLLSFRWRSGHMALATFAAFALPLLLLLSACGVSTTSTGGAAQGTGTASSTMTPGGTNVSTTPTDAVALTPDHSTYTASSTIVVTVTNNRDTSIFTFDHQTSCTILVLQRQDASGWKNVGGCAMGIATRRVEIKAGETMKIALAPGAGQIHATPWAAGTYRATVHYTLPGQDVGAAGVTVATPTFTVA